jgi:hypothetical protein
MKSQLIDYAKKLITTTKNLKDSEIQLLSECDDGKGEHVLIIDMDKNDDRDPWDFYGEYIIFGNGIEPYKHISTEQPTLGEVIEYIDNKISDYKKSNKLLVTMEDIYDSKDYTFYHHKGDSGDFYIKFMGFICNLGITYDKKFYLKDVSKIPDWEDDFYYEGLEQDPENDWKASVHFSKYEKDLTPSEFVDMVINKFLSENDDCMWKSLLPPGIIVSENVIFDNRCFQLSFKNKSKMLKSLEKMISNFKKIKLSDNEND